VSAEPLHPPTATTLLLAGSDATNCRARALILSERSRHI